MPRKWNCPERSDRFSIYLLTSLMNLFFIRSQDQCSVHVDMRTGLKIRQTRWRLVTVLPLFCLCRTKLSIHSDFHYRYAIHNVQYQYSFRNIFCRVQFHCLRHLSVCWFRWLSRNGRTQRGLAGSPIYESFLGGVSGWLHSSQSS